MSTKRCVNASCGASAPGGAWRKGWLIRSGGFATLCDTCGLAYEKLVFCESFHQKESGWRECTFCGKRLHCGCIASKSMLDLLDGGGVQCINCLKIYGCSSISGEFTHNLLPQSSLRPLKLSAMSSIDEKMNEFGILPAVGLPELQIVKHNFMQLDSNGYSTMLLSHRESTNGSLSHIKLEQTALYRGELRRPDSLTEGCLSMSLGGSNMESILEDCSSGGAQQFSPANHTTIADGGDQSKVFTAFQSVQRGRNALSKPPKASHVGAPKELISQMRVARPPTEGRGRNQLLPRYWPRITDQELQQISGDSNSTIVPLFEKVLSASDAGRIGRLVLPKACAEAYFPPISQPEGLPLRIQDAKGKEWHFQFRFWPNNNSRMYVLEGVTPCIQSLQLQAGDTVTFSRIDPEGKLVMGFRKATNTAPLQDSQISALGAGAFGNEAFFSGVNENVLVSGYSGLQSLKATGDHQLSQFSASLIYTDGDAGCIKSDKHESWANEGLLQPLRTPEKRSRNIGLKSKRLIMDDEDAMELKLSWEEAQDLLRPPPSVKPSIVIIEDQEFEEYEEPPVIGKKTFFTARASGVQDQWIQCDDCFKWRKIPLEILPPSKWTCLENAWDSKRTSCAEPDELTSKELHYLIRQHAELKRRCIAPSKQFASEAELTGLDALAAAVSPGEASNQASHSAAVTTRHPRHRPGCTCIVCIQPPSGKGPKHSPACTCNVCMTVKRRFKTLMMRKKKRQSELEGANTSSKEREACDTMETLDLNSQPRQRAAAGLSAPAPMSMIGLLQVASLPLDSYMKQNKIGSLAVSEQQGSSGSPIVDQAVVDSESAGDF